MLTEDIEERIKELAFNDAWCHFESNPDMLMVWPTISLVNESLKSWVSHLIPVDVKTESDPLFQTYAIMWETSIEVLRSNEPNRHK